jgi:hypothetical protein
MTSNTNSRSCEAHECYGGALIVGDLVRFRLGESAEATKVINIINGTEGCYLGFLPRCITKGARRNEMKDAFVQVILLTRI